MLTRELRALPLLCMCGAPLRVTETREDPEHPLAPAVWRLRECSGPERHRLATVQWQVAAFPERLGARLHACLDCGATFASVEAQVSMAEAEERLTILARERMTLARAGRRRELRQAVRAG